jgi:GNAT superfamily N-acetyltransferase
MDHSVVDVDLDRFHLIPKRCLESVFWELAASDPDVDPRFEKEEWFSSTLLEWGSCGKLAVLDDTSVGFVQFAPATLFAKLSEFRAARGVGIDAVYLGYVYAEEGHRGRRLGTQLIRSVARDVVDRGYRAVESIGDRAWDGGWILPYPFLAAAGFTVAIDEPRYPLMRLDLHRSVPAARADAFVAAGLPVSE